MSGQETSRSVEASSNGGPPTAHTDDGGPSNKAEDAEDSPENVELDAEADAMMLELARSQAEVQEMLLEQRVQNEELGGLKEGITNELQGLQEDAWKLQMYSELEMLKSQLATLTNLETSLDAAEAILDGDEEDAGAAGQSDALASTAAIINRVSRRAAGASGGRDSAGQIDQDGGGVEAGDEDDDSELDYEGDAATIAAMQATLDAELAQMYTQLQAVKAQAADVSVRKAQLEAELDALLAQQLEDEQEEDAAALDVASLQLSPSHS